MHKYMCMLRTGLELRSVEFDVHINNKYSTSKRAANIVWNCDGASRAPSNYLRVRPGNEGNIVSPAGLPGGACGQREHAPPFPPPGSGRNVGVTLVPVLTTPTPPYKVCWSLARRVRFRVLDARTTPTPSNNLCWPLVRRVRFYILNFRTLGMLALMRAETMPSEPRSLAIGSSMPRPISSLPGFAAVTVALDDIPGDWCLEGCSPFAMGLL